MKFKILVLFLFLPLSVHGATNAFNNVLIKQAFIFTGGTPGANKVLTSDANGNYTPQTISSIDPTSLTNITLVSTPFIVATGQGTKTITITGVGTVITNNASPTFGALTVTTINGKTPINLVTNITSSTLTVTGQGTSTFNIEGGSGAAALTNANNFFISSSTNTFNGGIITSNLVMTGGMTVNRKVVAANYTNLANDYYIAWLGTTSAQPTNFLNTGFANGKTYIIKDSQRSAGTTNIVVKPLSTDTIMGTNAYILNINSQSITITYDGTSNWEIN